MHQVRFVSYQEPMLLQCCELSCFYVHCVDRNPKLCELDSHVSPWSLKKLKLLNISNVKGNDV